MIQEFIRAFLRHAAYASGALVLGLLLAELLIPGSVAPFLPLPLLIITALILQFVRSSSKNNLFDKIYTLTLAIAFSVFIWFLFDAPGMSSLILKIALQIVVASVAVASMKQNFES